MQTEDDKQTLSWVALQLKKGRGRYQNTVFLIYFPTSCQEAPQGMVAASSAGRVALSGGFRPGDRRSAELSASQAVPEHGEDPQLPVHLRSGPVLFCSFPVRAGLLFHGVKSPCVASPTRDAPISAPGTSVLPTDPPCTPPVAVPCCTGPRCPKSCGVEPCLHV